MTTYTRPTPDQLASYVHRLSSSRADATRNEWVKIGMAIHDGDSSEYGYGLFEDFSRQSDKFDPRDCWATWKSFKPGRITVATLIGLANEDSPVERFAAEPSKRSYVSLQEYAELHGAPLEAFAAAGWQETGYEYEGKFRLSASFLTTNGPRWRFLDGDYPPYIHGKGFRRCWYRLNEAIEIAKRTGRPLVLCNGETSTIVGQWHGVAAFCVAGGSEKSTIPTELLDELHKLWDGPILIALDCDSTGRQAAAGLEAQMRSAGFEAQAVDLNGSDGFDLADFCRLHHESSSTTLTTLSTLTNNSHTDSHESGESRPARFTVRGLSDLAAIQPPSWLLTDELIAGAFNLIYGQSGSGKTFYAIDRALRVAGSGKLVLYIATEDLAGLKMRVAAWRAAFPEIDTRTFAWLDMSEGLDLSDQRQVNELLTTVQPLGFSLITIDTLREAHTGDENSSQDMAAVNRAIQRLIRETGAALDVVHHSGVNDGRERGSTALSANCDLKLKVSNDDGLVLVSCEKLRNGSPLEQRRYRLSQVTLSESESPGAILRPANTVTTRDEPLTPSQRKILEALALSIFTDVGARTSQVSSATGIPESSLYRALSSLKNRGYLSQGTKGDPYTITSAGRGALGPEFTLAPSAMAEVDSHEEEPQQNEQLSPLSVNSHALSRECSSITTDSLSLSHTVGVRDESESESSQPIEREFDPLERVNWPTVHSYLASGDVDKLESWCRGMWKIDPDLVFTEAHRRWPELDMKGKADVVN